MYLFPLRQSASVCINITQVHARGLANAKAPLFFLGRPLDSQPSLQALEAYCQPSLHQAYSKPKPLQLDLRILAGMHAGQRINVCITCTGQGISEAAHFASAWLCILLRPTRYICLNCSLTLRLHAFPQIFFSVGGVPLGQTAFLLCLCCLLCLCSLLCLCLLLCLLLCFCRLLWHFLRCQAQLQEAVVVASGVLEVVLLAAWASVHAAAVPWLAQFQCAAG